jgi:hypothetical protein
VVQAASAEIIAHVKRHLLEDVVLLLEDVAIKRPQLEDAALDALVVQHAIVAMYAHAKD